MPHSPTREYSRASASCAPSISAASSGVAALAVAPLLFDDLEQQPLQRVDRLVGALQPLLVQRRELAQALAALGSERQRFAWARSCALLEDVGQILPALLLAADLLDARQRDLVVGLEPQDLVVQLLGLVGLPEALAQARDVVVQRHGGVDRAELVDGAEVDLDDAIPAVVLRRRRVPARRGSRRP